MLMLGLPILIIGFHLLRVYRQLWGETVGDGPLGAVGTAECSVFGSSTYSLSRAKAGANSVAAGRLRDTEKRIVHFFVRLFVVFVVMWIPAALCIWVVVSSDVDTVLGAWVGGRHPHPRPHSQSDPDQVLVAWIGGTISHLQGPISAALYLQKADIYDEMRSLHDRWLSSLSW